MPIRRGGGDHVVEFARKHGIRTTYRDFRNLLADKRSTPMPHVTHLRCKTGP
jgi:hypothetical protein